MTDAQREALRFMQVMWGFDVLDETPAGSPLAELESICAAEQAGEISKEEAHARARTLYRERVITDADRL